MAQKEISKRHHLIINQLRKGAKNFDEIKDYVETEFEIFGYELHLSKRTFHRDIQDIQSLYNVEIKYNRSNFKYSIEFEEKDYRLERISEAFDIANILNVDNNFAKYINFEDRSKNGTHFMLDVLTAIKNRKTIVVYYQKYTDNDITKRELEPYALKEHKYKWYIVAKNNEKIKTFGLDRVLSIQQTKKSFEYPADFNVNEFYKYYFGVKFSDKKPIQIELSFDALQGKYLKNLPLHHSQKIKYEDAEKIIITLKLIPTIDFKQELLKYADTIEILKPKKLREEIYELHSKSIKINC